MLFKNLIRYYSKDHFNYKLFFLTHLCFHRNSCDNSVPKIYVSLWFLSKMIFALTKVHAQLTKFTRKINYTCGTRNSNEFQDKCKSYVHTASPTSETNKRGKFPDAACLFAHTGSRSNYHFWLMWHVHREKSYAKTWIGLNRWPIQQPIGTTNKRGIGSNLAVENPCATLAWWDQLIRHEKRPKPENSPHPHHSTTVAEHALNFRWGKHVRPSSWYSLESHK